MPGSRGSCDRIGDVQRAELWPTFGLHVNPETRRARSGKDSAAAAQTLRKSSTESCEL